jgi:Ni,Fe-hydrogenase I cytochrome b subunit
LKQGEKISNLEIASQNLIHLPLTICKKTLKRIYKRICKNKTCGASVVQNVKNKETIHAYLMKIYWFNSKKPLHLQLCKLVQLCTSIFALVCVGINHQKGGD